MFRVGFFFLLILIATAHTDAENGILIPRPAAVEPALSVAGDWDGQLEGTIVERSDGGRVGDSQTDSIVFSLRQSGSEVTGEVVFAEGWPDEIRAPLSGSVVGREFNYRAELQVAGCLLTVEGETRLNPAANEFSGDQTQSNCEGRAVGRIICIKRKRGEVAPGSFTSQSL